MDIDQIAKEIWIDMPCDDEGLQQQDSRNYFHIKKVLTKHLSQRVDETWMEKAFEKLGLVSGLNLFKETIKEFMPIGIQAKPIDSSVVNIATEIYMMFVKYGFNVNSEYDIPEIKDGLHILLRRLVPTAPDRETITQKEIEEKAMDFAYDIVSLVQNNSIEDLETTVKYEISERVQSLIIDYSRPSERETIHIDTRDLSEPSKCVCGSELLNSFPNYCYNCGRKFNLTVA